MILPTRHITNADGHLEIVRVLNGPELEDWDAQDPLAYEGSIVWLQPLESLDYVRVAVVREARGRRGPLALDGKAVTVGYTKLTANAPPNPKTGLYTRRVFFLLPADFSRNMIDLPPGVVDPETVLPGRMGDLPDLTDLLKGYPRHVRDTHRSALRHPLDIGRILMHHRQVQLAH